MDGTRLMGAIYLAVSLLCGASIAKNIRKELSCNVNLQTSPGKYFKNISFLAENIQRKDSMLSQSIVAESESSLRRVIRQTSTSECPKNFDLKNQYCIRITEEKPWTEAYEDCFKYGIEKTPLDTEKYWLKFVDDLFKDLNNLSVSHFWLAAQRKISGGPIYYSGPVQSDFDYYNSSHMQKFNVTWNNEPEEHSECVVFDIAERKLDIKQCDETIRFVCLFPSEFWNKSITHDSFICSSSDGLCNQTDSMTWEDAQINCNNINSNNNELIDTENKFYNSTVEGIAHDKRINLFYEGRQNTKLGNMSSLEYFEWTKSKGKSKVFKTFKDGFMIQQYDSVKFACVPGKKNIGKNLYIKGPYKWNEFTVSSDKMEVSTLYGIKCYLNGKLVKSGEKSTVTVSRPGNLFCESLTHTPTKLITSNSIQVENPHVLTFVCEIHIPGQQYDFHLHDLSFKRAVNDSTLYYEKLLKEKLKDVKLSIFSVDEIIPQGIKLVIFIEVSDSEEQVLEIHRNISLLLEFSDMTLRTKNITAKNLRNTKYCLPKIEEAQSGCETNITWHLTLRNKIDECIACDKLYTRNCSKKAIAGTEYVDWDQVEINNVSKDSRTRRLCNPKKYLNEVTSMFNNVFTTLDTGNQTNLTSTFIKDFEHHLLRKEINSSIEVDNSPVIIYSSSLNKSNNAYFLKEMEFFKQISGNRTIESQIEKENAIFALYINYNNSYRSKEGNESILLSYFENDTIFPIESTFYAKASSVFLLNVSDTNLLIFPINIMFTLKHENESNASPICGFWNEIANKWEVIEGDTLEGRTKNGLYNCSYYHLSCFALLMHARDDGHEKVLDIISQVGCYLSLIGLGVILFAFIVQRRWRDKDKYPDQKILGFLSLSLFIMYLIFVAAIDHVSEKQMGLCIAVGALLHYFILASFCWMSVVAFNNYYKFVIVIYNYIPRFMWKASLYAFFIPLVPIVITLSINPRLYTDGTICWVHSEGFYYGFLLPSCLFWVLNIVIFILILRSIFNTGIIPSRHKKNHSVVVSQVVLSLFLSIMLGLSWVFGFFAATQISISFSYLFIITTTLQGFLMFVFFILLEWKHKSRWMRMYAPCFKRKQDAFSGAPTTSMTLTGLQKSTVSNSRI
ncbi:hypothetical protein C0J52_04541 [Blattella germanica]|nr:hypothetical protein C0J52_04541 [Blattella germanica]